jgi:hypothetical protein
MFADVSLLFFREEGNDNPNKVDGLFSLISEPQEQDTYSPFCFERDSALVTSTENLVPRESSFASSFSSLHDIAVAMSLHTTRNTQTVLAMDQLKKVILQALRPPMPSPLMTSNTTSLSTYPNSSNSHYFPF